jgi:phosphate starvation-inducible protein PhoH
MTKSRSRRNDTSLKTSSRSVDRFVMTLTAPQKKVVNFIKSNKVSLITGEAGTGKDTCCFYMALEGLMNTTYEKLIVVRPIIPAGPSLGYLKGSLDEKTQPYEDFYNYHLSKIINKVELDKVKTKIEFETSQFIRGKNWDNSIIIVSESQNFTLHELITIVTRVADTSIVVFNGDLMQSDIGNKTGFQYFIDILSSVDGIDHMHLGEEYQMRSKMITVINKKYLEYLNRFKN